VWEPKKPFGDCVQCPEPIKSYGSPEKYLKPTIDYSLKNKIINTKSDALIAHIRVQSKGTQASNKKYQTKSSSKPPSDDKGNSKCV